MSVRMKSRIFKQRSCIKFSTPNCKEKQERSSSLKQSRKTVSGARSAELCRRGRGRSKTTETLKRYSGSSPLQQVLWPPFPVSLKANGSLLAHFATVSTKGLATAITILPLSRAAENNVFPATRPPDGHWKSASSRAHSSVPKDQPRPLLSLLES